jgi:thiol-disulfide isomerase/thioredoxin
MPCFSQKAEVLDFETFKSRYLKGDSDTLYVINFWATWCVPCVKELPYFEQAREVFKGQKVEVVLASLDFPGQIDSRLNPFLKKRGIKSKTIFLDAPGENIWIPQISGEWSGAIPATLIINPKRNCSTFYEKAFNLQELVETIQKNITLCGN